MFRNGTQKNDTKDWEPFIHAILIGQKFKLISKIGQTSNVKECSDVCLPFFDIKHVVDE